MLARKLPKKDAEKWENHGKPGNMRCKYHRKIILETLVAIFLRMADGYTGFFVPYEI